MVAYLTKHSLFRWLQTDERWMRNGRHFNKKAHHKKPFGWAFEPSLSRCLVSPSAVMIHRSLFHWHGFFDASLPVCEDYDLLLRFLRYHPIGLCDKVTMIKHGGHSDQLSTSFQAMDNFRLAALLKQWHNDFPNIDRTNLSSAIIKKCNILKQGAKKRNLSLDVYDRVLDALE